MKKILVILAILFVAFGCQKTTDDKELVNFNKLEKINFEKLDEYLAEGYTGIMYYGWIVNCGDSLNFQNNYLEERLETDSTLKDNLIVVNLELDIPDALVNKDLRAPMTEKYDVRYSPTIVYYKDGVVVEKLEWTALTSDPKTAIAKDVLDEFFAKYK